MNISKINSAPAFRGLITIPVKDDFERFVEFNPKNIDEIKTYKNGTRLFGRINDVAVDYFVSNKQASFQDIAAAYNLAKNNDINVDLTTNNMDLVV